MKNGYSADRALRSGSVFAARHVVDLSLQLSTRAVPPRRRRRCSSGEPRRSTTALPRSVSRLLVKAARCRCSRKTARRAASPTRCLPSGVRGRVDPPPCIRQCLRPRAAHAPNAMRAASPAAGAPAHGLASQCRPPTLSARPRASHRSSGVVQLHGRGHALFQTSPVILNRRRVRCSHRGVSR